MTLRDVAAYVGLSVAAVSRALNGHPDVSEATRRRILRAARRLGYQPNAAAKTLVTRRSHLIGVYFLPGATPSRFSEPFVSQVVDGLLEGLSRAGYDLLFFGAGTADGAPSFLELASRREVDGAVFLGLRTDDPRWEELRRFPIPSVSLDVPIPASRAVCVGSDHLQGSAAVAEHLLSLGHTAIAMINGHTAAPVSWERLTGFSARLQQVGVHLRPEWVVSGDFTEEGGYQAARRLLSSAVRPTAIFAASDLMALGALRAARELGVRVPEELSIAGYDDIDDAARAVPALTTVHQDRRAIGMTAASAAVQLIEAPDHPPRRGFSCGRSWSYGSRPGRLARREGGDGPAGRRSDG
ncbi:MAG: LacI family DNA-binding transcriptional regulator [Limnochordaceae bacterium]|nr:LacI family DNA-binding transcriptional regulator [Limnochordaceae bacterium]